MSAGTVILALAVFLSSAVESVEALTIVIAAGVSGGWRSALEGAGAAIVVLGAIVAVLGPAIVAYVPLDALRTVIGTVLLIFGLQWLRKAVLRAAGLKAKHDEDAIYARHISEMAGPRPRGTRDTVALTVAFKGVFLEGLEIVIIVLTLGGTDRDLPLAALAATAAIVVVSAIGAIVARQLAGVPENAMKLTVGLMLTSFGSFWAGEGLGVHWPGSDLAIPALIGIYAVATWILVRTLVATSPGGARVS